jgi:hypothetical protein
VKNLKFGVLLCGLIGVVGFFVPSNGVKMFDLAAFDAKMVYIPLAGLAVAMIMGILGAAKPPFTKMHAIVATVGNLAALLFVTGMKPHQIFRGFGDSPMGAKLIVIGIVLGLILSIVSAVKSEEA